MAKSREKTRQRRKMHIRKKLHGTKERPRVFLFKSNKYIYLGVANDDDGKVLFSLKGEKNGEGAIKLAKDFAKKLKTKKIDAVVFDRSGYKYTGVVKKLADTLREAKITV
jgi:large subunit ribosomal protein L18